jgi:hypothetical protein
MRGECGAIQHAARRANALHSSDANDIDIVDNCLCFVATRIVLGENNAQAHFDIFAIRSHDLQHASGVG